MKKIKNVLLLIASVLAIYSCETDADTVAEISDEAGMIIDVNTTLNSSILGSPEAGVDLDEAMVTITNAYLNLTVSLTAGSLDDVEKIEIVKSFNGGTEAVVAESTTLPLNIEISDLQSLFEGLGVSESDLRIGDVLTFRTKVYQTDGDVYYYSTSLGNYDMVVNCSSDLAASYVIDYTSGPGTHVVTELSPGLYEMDSMMGWPGSGYTITFTDTCGILSIINDWQFSNVIYGEGYVDNDGNIVWETSGVENVYDGSSWIMYRQ